MIPCKHCNVLNSLDSTFCKRCGTGLPESEIEAGKVKLDTLVQDGMHSLNEGRVNEAMAIAESAVVADPSLVSGWALKAAAHERLGQIVEALECAEKIVELNPDSELDKIRRNQLRVALGAQALANAPQSKAAALIAAVAIAIILVGIVILGAHFLDRPQPEVRLTPNNLVATTSPIPNQVPGGSFAPPSGPPAQQATTPAATPPPATGSNAGLGNLNGGSATPPSAQANSDDGNAGVKPSGTLPGSEVNPLVVKPADLPASINTATGQAALTTPPTGKPVAPASHDNSDPSPIVDQAPTKTAPKAPDNGQIIITVHHDLTGQSGSNRSEDVRDTSKMYSKMGNDSFLIGNFSQAAQHFQKALTSGADPIYVNERLGQTYSSLGRKQDATESYHRAIDACTTALTAGKGDSTRIRAIRDACETAVQQLQGG